eukprot:COSAG02_NODE_72_length_41961_cov_13.243658_22_plen_695_part_00
MRDAQHATHARRRVIAIDCRNAMAGRGAGDEQHPEVAQRWVEATHELSTRRVLTRKTLVIRASDGSDSHAIAAGRGPATKARATSRVSAGAVQQQQQPATSCGTGGALKHVAVHIFSDMEQADLLGESFRTDQQVVAELEPHSSLQTASVVLDLEGSNSNRANDNCRNLATDASQAEVVDRFRAVRIWAPHRVLSQFVIDTCRACLPLTPAPEPREQHDRHCSVSSAALDNGRPGVVLGANSTILDLNAGTGVCGVFASHALAAMGNDGHVYLADRCTATLPLLELNTGLNKYRRRTSVCKLGLAPLAKPSARFELQGVGGVVAPKDASIDAIISVLDSFDDDDGRGTKVNQLWSVIHRYLSTSPSAWVALACVEASTLHMCEDGEVVGIKRKSRPECDSTNICGHESLSEVARWVLGEASPHGFELHHSQPTVRCLPGAHRERSIRVLVFIRKRSHQPQPTDSVLAPAFAAVASRLSSLSRALLLDRCDPSHVRADELLDSIDAISPSDRAAARLVLHGSVNRAVHRVMALDATQCEVLCDYCRGHLQMEPDSVDGAPDSQVQLTLAELRKLLGSETTRDLLRLPAVAGLMEEAQWSGAVDCFLRRYTARTRPFIPFHCDGAAATVNVALTPSGIGGELLCLHSGRVIVEQRCQGEATVHPAGLLHGVTRLETSAQERFTMILFFEPPPVQAK